MQRGIAIIVLVRKEMIVRESRGASSTRRRDVSRWLAVELTIVEAAVVVVEVVTVAAVMVRVKEPLGRAIGKLMRTTLIIHVGHSPTGNVLRAPMYVDGTRRTTAALPFPRSAAATPTTSTAPPPPVLVSVGRSVLPAQTNASGGRRRDVCPYHPSPTTSMTRVTKVISHPAPATPRRHRCRVPRRCSGTTSQAMECANPTARTVPSGLKQSTTTTKSAVIIVGTMPSA
mmetsp:Transcript_10965/g.16705  ORF Transcript_10965/g.16705 Transcript_10965/m.16705 type:complete len:229 (-) Transcript_10965:468-1154(-)